MQIETKFTPNKLNRPGINLIPILVVIVLLIIKFWWKTLFISGRIDGIYWLFVFTDNENFVFLLAGLYLILSFVLLMIFAFNVFAHHGNYRSLGQNSLVLFLCSLTIVFAVFLDFHYETTPVAELNMQGKVFYLAEYREQSIAFEYGLYQCDSYGFLCRRVNPPNLYYDPPNPKLIYNQTNHTISIFVYGEGVIYEYNLP